MFGNKILFEVQTKKSTFLCGNWVMKIKTLNFGIKPRAKIFHFTLVSSLMKDVHGMVAKLSSYSNRVFSIKCFNKSITVEMKTVMLARFVIC